MKYQLASGFPPLSGASASLKKDSSCRENTETHHLSVVLWELSCGGFRHSAGFHARVVLDGAACRLKELGDVHDVLDVLGVVLVPIVLRVLVSQKEE